MYQSWPATRIFCDFVRVPPRRTGTDASQDEGADAQAVVAGVDTLEGQVRDRVPAPWSPAGRAIMHAQLTGDSSAGPPAGLETAGETASPPDDSTRRD